MVDTQITPHCLGQSKWEGHLTVPHRFLDRRALPSKPRDTNPNPSIVSVAGSGVGVGILT